MKGVVFVPLNAMPLKLKPTALLMPPHSVASHDMPPAACCCAWHAAHGCACASQVSRRARNAYQHTYFFCFCAPAPRAAVTAYVVVGVPANGGGNITLTGLGTSLGGGRVGGRPAVACGLLMGHC